MEVSILSHEDNTTVFNINGTDHTVLQALAQEVQNSADVVAASVRRSHPLKEDYELIVQVKKGDAKKIVLAAISSLDKAYADFDKQFSKAAPQ